MPQDDSRWMRAQVRRLKEDQARIAAGPALDAHQQGMEEWRQQVIDKLTRDLLRRDR